MALLRLPPETLTHIFDYVGSSFFREDLGRLTVCKYWFEFALPACFKHVTVSEKSLRRLMVSGRMERLWRLEGNMEKLEIGVPGYEAFFYDDSQENTEPRQESNASIATTTTTTSDETPRDWKDWAKVLNDDLSQLAITAQRSCRLRTLRIRAWRSAEFFVPGLARDYLLIPTLQSLLSVKRLKVLVLDLSIGVLTSPREDGRDHHICPMVGNLLCSLQILHLRMPSICADAIKPRDEKEMLPLAQVAINLSVSNNIFGEMPTSHSQHCGSQGERWSQLQLRAEMLKQAEVLATRMSSPKTMRIITHSLPSFERHSLDVLTGKTMKLDDGMGWEEDGEIIGQDSEPESEISSDDFSDF
ncbi:hypothetical protein GGS20DRAFT_349191 [Poronia punctata]|nr:hypothetical protein GGS20DRAFT_349191 [Poronia punctata]